MFEPKEKYDKKGTYSSGFRNSGSDARKIISSVLVLFLLLSVIFVSGCVQPATTIKSEREVGEAVTNISSDVEDVSQILNDIDRKLG